MNLTKDVSTIKKVVTRLIYYSGLSYLLRSIGRNDVVIISYHRVVNDDINDYIKRKEFRRQMQYLRKHYNVISLEDYILHGEKVKNAVIITFDDGYQDFYDNAYPILKAFNLPSTIFVATKNVNTKDMFWWDRLEEIIVSRNLNEFKIGNETFTVMELFNHLRKKNEEYRELYIRGLIKKYNIKFSKKPLYLSWKELKEISNNGVCIGGHTHSHIHLSKLSYREQKEEIGKSRDILSKQLKTKIPTFCYPYGDFDEDTIKVLKELNFICGCTSYFGLNSQSSDKYKLKRIGISKKDDLITFKVKMTGILEALKF